MQRVLFSGLLRCNKNPFENRGQFSSLYICVLYMPFTFLPFSLQTQGVSVELDGHHLKYKEATEGGNSGSPLIFKNKKKGRCQLEILISSVHICDINPALSIGFIISCEQCITLLINVIYVLKHKKCHCFLLPSNRLLVSVGRTCLRRTGL